MLTFAKFQEGKQIFHKDFIWIKIFKNHRRLLVGDDGKAIRGFPIPILKCLLSSLKMAKLAIRL